MADTKISQLPAASTPTGSEVVPIVQGGANRRATASQLAAPAVAAHEAANDPHPQYQTQAEGDARYATAAQGTKADTAVQPAALGSYLTAAAAAAGYQPLDSDLTAIAALSTTAFGRALLELADAAAGRTALGLGTAATTAASAYATAAQGTKADTAVQPADLSGYLTSATAASTYQPLDSDLTAIAALSTTAFGRSLLTQADAAATRTTIGAAGTAVVTTSAAGLQPATSFAALTYSATVNLDLAALDGQVRTITLTGDLTLTNSNLAASRTVVIRLLPGASQRTLTFPTGWAFYSDKPATIAANKGAVLSLTYFGTADTDCVAVYKQQP